MTKPNVERAFQSFGRLMAKIGGLEQFMRIALGEHTVRRMKATGKDDKAELERQATKIMKMDFGSLLQQVCTKFD